MATYDELLSIATSGTGSVLFGRVQVACLVACDGIRQEADATVNHANRMKWASVTLQDPQSAAKRMMLALLAQNRAATATQITGASDATVQAAVDAAVNMLAQG